MSSCRALGIVAAGGFTVLVFSLVMTGCGGSEPTATGNGSGGSNSGSSAEYIFTTDNLTYHPTEFLIEATGSLQPTTNTVPSLVSRATTRGVVFLTTGMNPSLQSYMVRAKGGLQPQGPAAPFTMDKFATVATDGNSYVYALTDTGIYGFSISGSGLSPLPQIFQTVESPCTPAQENSASPCEYIADLLFGNSSAFLLEQNIPPFQGSQPAQLSQFGLTNGVLGPEQLLTPGITTSPSLGSLAAATPDGHFFYFVDSATGRILRYDTTNPDTSPTPNILSNGNSMSARSSQLLVSGNGQFLLTAVSDPSAKTSIHVFQIDPSSGSLSEVAGSPFATNEKDFVQMTLDPAQHFLLAIHAECRSTISSDCTIPGKLVAMSFNSSTGTLAVTSDVQDGYSPATITAAPVSQ